MAIHYNADDVNSTQQEDAALPDDSPRKIAIAANPYSGRGRNRRHLDALIAALSAAGYQVQPLWEKAALAELAATEGFAETYRCVIAAGGDGTLLHVVNQCRTAPVVVYPMGNENLFARQFGCRCDPRQTVDTIARGRIRQVDLGRAGDRYFTLVASAGFDGYVAQQLAQWRQHGDGLKRVGRLSYALPILRGMRQYDYHPMTITADGQKFDGCLVMAFNINQYAMKLDLAPGAEPDDGLLDYVIFERPGSMRLFGYALSVMFGRHCRRRDVHHGRARRITIEAQSPVPVEIDGDAVGITPVDISIEPGALRIFDSSRVPG